MRKFASMASTLAFGVVFVIGLYSADADAVPAFVSKTGKSCAYCHNAWPQLNEKGRAFKETGFRISSEDHETLAEMLTEGRFPIGGLIKARPYDKKDSGDNKLRAFHEFELFFAGRVSDNFSAFVEFEAEDETGFEIEVSPAVLTYHLNTAANLQFTWGPYLFADPYGFLGDNYRLSRGRPAVIDKAFGGSDGSLSSTRQSVSLTGRPLSRLFYIAGVGGESNDAEGVEAENYFGRLAVDIADNMMVGGFGVNGTNNTASRDFSRYGMDFQADFSNTRLQAAFVKATDDNPAPATGDAENTAFSVQLYHTFTSGAESRVPTWVPLLRYDRYESNDGADKYTEATFNLGYYFAQNVRGYVEYWNQIDVPSNIEKDNRLTFELAVGF